MGSIWLLVIIVVGTANGSVQVKTDVRWPNDPNYNTEKLCDTAGQTLADKMQVELGTNNGVVFWQCQQASLDEMLKGAGKVAPTANGQEL